MKQTTSLSGQS